MKIVLFSDIHANLPAFEAAMVMWKKQLQPLKPARSRTNLPTRCAKHIKKFLIFSVHQKKGGIHEMYR
jgi:hypothetical protein